jgi:hypothetical protein
MITVFSGPEEIADLSFAPQDSNSSLSSVAATERMLDPETWSEKKRCLNPFLFREV